MRTGTMVLAMTGSGLLGGIAGALLFLTFFAEEFRPEAPPPSRAPVAESPFTDEEETALRRLPRKVDELAAGLEALRKERSVAPPVAPGTKPAGAAAAVDANEEEIRANELAVIATLRNLCSCQAQVQTSGKIDCDNDGIGEYGTFLEMTGSTGVRKGFTAGAPSSADFSAQGTQINPPIVSPAMADVDNQGMVVKKGYVYMMFLPDTMNPAGFVHERSGPGLVGGTGRISVDLSETTWCMYAWPAGLGTTGRRAFFVNQAGDVLQSSNENARHGGNRVIDARSAFRGAGITSQVAVGTKGQDGDVWKVAN
jgi:hypothetical protein